MMFTEKNDCTECQDWLVTDGGDCVAVNLEELALPEKPYRLYRFLTELEDILDTITDDSLRIQAIIPLVRKLLASSYWLQIEFTEPPTDPGWSVQFLYDEYEFPLTVQMVAWLPGHVSPIHNHATWGIVAIISGQEKISFGAVLRPQKIYQESNILVRKFWFLVILLLLHPMLSTVLKR
jgi:hypothetical protein